MLCARCAGDIVILFWCFCALMFLHAGVFVRWCFCCGVVCQVFCCAGVSVALVFLCAGVSVALAFSCLGDFGAGVFVVVVIFPGSACGSICPLKGGQKKSIRVFLKMGDSKNGCFITKNDLNWMIWGRRYFEKHAYFLLMVFF